jgi:hypothetical protein
MTENERFGLVFVKTGSKFGHWSAAVKELRDGQDQGRKKRERMKL